MNFVICEREYGGHLFVHHTRKTHNAHNETQRRLKKILSKGYTINYWSVPHYTYVEYLNDERWFVHPYWAYTHFSDAVITKKKRARVFESFAEAEFERRHSHLMRKSKSSGRHSNYGFYKRILHKRWRRKGLDEQTFLLKGSHISWKDIGF